MLFLGIDWADDHHDVVLTDEQCTDVEGYRERLRIPHTLEGFAQLHEKVRAYESDPSQVLVALETPHGLLVRDLLQAGYSVYAINPKAVNRYKDRHTLSSAKDDQRDALAMAHLLRTDRHRFTPLRLRPDAYRLLEQLCQDLRQLTHDKTRLVNRLSACLKEYYPQALGLFSQLDAPISLAFLQAFPDPPTLQAVSYKRFAAFFAKKHYSHPERVETLYQQTRQPAPSADPMVERAARMRMQALVDQLLTLKRHHAAYERQIQQLFETLSQHTNLPTLPGVGERLAPELAAALGPCPEGEAQQPDTPDAMARLGGCAPITRQSGKYKQVAFRRSCDKRLRRTLHDWAQGSLRSSRWARAYYDYYKAQGRQHNTLLRNLSCKLLLILYRLWRTGEEYDEQVHINHLKAKNVVWAMNL
jgi:transposase